mmetsp:Transcript_12264/g.29164  ORF Transcript_12264/g.29164 Transcript_12264/m.29164 type:complete len:210 (-) Transcript_12264:22-651(-)
MPICPVLRPQCIAVGTIKLSGRLSSAHTALATALLRAVLLVRARPLPLHQLHRVLVASEAPAVPPVNSVNQVLLDGQPENAVGHDNGANWRWVVGRKHLEPVDGDFEYGVEADDRECPPVSDNRRDVDVLAWAHYPRRVMDSRYCTRWNLRGGTRCRSCGKQLIICCSRTPPCLQPHTRQAFAHSARDSSGTEHKSDKSASLAFQNVKT